MHETCQVTKRGTAERKISSGSERSPELSCSPEVRRPTRNKAKGKYNVCILLRVVD